MYVFTEPYERVQYRKNGRIMREDHEIRIATLFEALIQRLEFELEKQPPPVLPRITQSIIILDGYRTGSGKLDERHMVEMNLIKNVTQQIKGHGGNNGSNKDSTTPFQG